MYFPAILMEKIATLVDKIVFCVKCRGSMLCYHLWTSVELENLICIQYCKILGQLSKKLLGKTLLYFLLDTVVLMPGRKLNLTCLFRRD